MCVDNEPYNICSKCSTFSQNGRGYSLIFKIIKFGIYGLGLSLLPIAVIMMAIFSTGNDCVGKMGEEVEYTDSDIAIAYDRAKGYWPESSNTTSVVASSDSS
jgi:hypothetical protein